MNLRDLKAEVDDLCERDPHTAVALARRIHSKVQPDAPVPLTTLHQSLVGQQLQGRTDEELARTREMLERAGWDEADVDAAIAELAQPGLRAGQGFGGLHIEDLLPVVETLWRQGHGRFTLEVEFENPVDDHLNVTIAETDKAAWQTDEESDHD